MTRLIVPAAPRITCWPTSVEPVKPIFATSGCSISRWPATEPLPTTTFTTPSGIPASSASSASRSAESGVSSAGFSTTVLPARERRPELPGGDVEREVPRRDQPDDAERLAERHVDAARDRDRLAEVLVDRAGVVVEDLRHHPDLAARAPDRLADVPRLDLRQLLEMLLDERREPAQQPGPVGRRDRTPRRERRLRPRDRGVGLLDPGRFELGDDLLGRRIGTVLDRPCSFRYARASSTSASNRLASSPASGCQSTPSANRRDGSARAPRPSRRPPSATSRSPSPTRPNP